MTIQYNTQYIQNLKKFVIKKRFIVLTKKNYFKFIKKFEEKKHMTFLLHTILCYMTLLHLYWKKDCILYINKIMNIFH